GYSFNNNLYYSVKDLFSILSNVYAILIGFNISAVVFIVSFLFKESLNKVMYDKNKLNQLYKQIVNSFMLSTFNNLGIIVLGYSFNNNLYYSVKDLFSILSNVYAILIGFNISAVVFIVSFLFKESLNKVMYDKNKLNQLYKQIVNSFMLSTFNNLGVIVLGL